MTAASPPLKVISPSKKAVSSPSRPHQHRRPGPYRLPRFYRQPHAFRPDHRPRRPRAELAEPGHHHTGHGQLRRLRRPDSRPETLPRAARPGDDPRFDLRLDAFRRIFPVARSESSLLNPLGLCWPNPEGLARWPRTSSPAFKKALRFAEIDTSFRVHDLRHTCASLMVASECDIKTVSSQ
jgi:hypothetical protein